LLGLVLLWAGLLVLQLGPHDAVDHICDWLTSTSCSIWISDHRVIRAVLWTLWLAFVIWIAYALTGRLINWRRREKA
jgi:hypothetical protein